VIKSDFKALMNTSSKNFTKNDISQEKTQNIVDDTIATLNGGV